MVMTCGSSPWRKIFTPFIPAAKQQCFQAKANKMDRKKKILIVDDEAITGLSFSMILKNNGYEVCQLVTTGEEAFKRVEQEKPDMILMDILLGKGTSGIEVAKQIRSNHGMPIIFLTGYYDDKILESAKTIECSKIFIKPITPNEILSAIDQVFTEKCKMLHSCRVTEV